MASGDDVYQGLIARGFTPVAAAALAGNAQQESSFNPTAWNAQSGAGGLFQWRKDRLTGLQQYAKATNRSPGDLDTQLDYAVAELNGPENAAYRAIEAATDVPSANAAVAKYLRYGPNEGGKRLQYSLAFAGKPMPTNTDTTSQELDSIFGGSGSPSASDASSPDVSSGLDAIFGEAKNPFGTTSKPGTPQYASDAAAYIKAGGAKPPANPDEHPGIAPPTDVVPDWMRAFSAHAVEGVPVVGAFARTARNALIGPAAEAQMEAVEQRASQTAPAAAIAGDVFGTVAPLAAGGEFIPGAAKVLGMEGALPVRMGFGAASGAALTGADSLARGASPEQAGANALVGGGVGAGVPLVGAGFGMAKNAFFGPSGERMVANALNADQGGAANNVANLLTQRGPGATVADLGPNTQSLAAGLASLPGEAQGIVVNNLKARAAATGNRLAQDIQGTIGAGQPIGQLTDSIIAAQKAASDPLYAAVRTQPVQVTPALNSIAATPMGKAALTQAVTMMRNDGLQPSSTVALYDYAKQALDDMVSVAQRAGENNKARQATNLANQLRGEIDRQVPQYAQARDAFAGPAKVLDAVQMGQNLFSSKTSPEDLKAALSGMSSSEKDGLLAGAQAAVQKVFGTARTDAAAMKSLFDNDYGQQKLALLVGPDEAQQIANAIERERVFSSTSGKVTQNSMTASNLAQQKVVQPDLAAVPNRLMPQSTLGIVMSGLDKARRAITASYRNAQNVKAANLLTSPTGPAEAAQITAGARAPNALLAPASVPVLAEQQGIPISNALTWAQPALSALNIPHVVVNGATPSL